MELDHYKNQSLLETLFKKIYKAMNTINYLYTNTPSTSARNLIQITRKVKDIMIGFLIPSIAYHITCIVIDYTEN